MRAIIVVVVRQLEGEGIALVDGGNGAVIDFISYDGPSEWCGIAVGRIIVLLSVESGRNRPRTVDGFLSVFFLLSPRWNRQALSILIDGVNVGTAIPLSSPCCNHFSPS